MLICRPLANAARHILVLSLLSGSVLLVHPSAANASTDPLPQHAVWSQDLMHHGGTLPGAARRSASTDTFNIFGGNLPGINDRRPEGQFQTLFRAPDWQGWTSVDLTAQLPHWGSSTTNAANLDAAAGNRAMYCGVEAGESGYATAPGYGNNWEDYLQWELQVNPFLNTPFQLDFDYNLDLEPGFDFFIVEYDSNGTWVEHSRLSGQATDAHFSLIKTFTPIHYSGPSNNKRIKLRFIVRTDAANSDLDGGFDSTGAIQIDNLETRQFGSLVTAYGDGIATFEDLGGGTYDNEGWEPAFSVFAGDFSKILPLARDIDPCRENDSPVAAFLDNANPPKNGNGQSTGGSISPDWNYGVDSGWVNNYEGGLSLGLTSLHNEIWSPEISFDDTTTAMDDALVGGVLLRFSVWAHLPLQDGFRFTWKVRFDEGSGWGPWVDRGFVYFSDTATWVNVEEDISDLIGLNPTKVQVSLGVWDMAEILGFAGLNATPAPWFDNVSVWKYNIPGPVISTRTIDLYNDGFNSLGESSYTPDPTLLAVRLDMARDISSGTKNVPGDSITVDVAPGVPGSSIDSPPTMVWYLDANPLFDGVRTLPPGSTNVGASLFGGGTIWTGSVVADSASNNGTIVPGRWSFDFDLDGNGIAPHQGDEPAMFFPGDRLRYCIVATDNFANVATMPADTTGITNGIKPDGLAYSRPFTVKALPTMTDDGGGGITQPGILVVNDFGHGDGEAEMLSTFHQMGLLEGMDYDVYTVKGPTSTVGNGIGSAGAHGATPVQIAGYECLVYLSGQLSDGLLSNGTAQNGNDKGNDLAILSGWHEQPGDRYAVFFGDGLYSFLNGADSSGPDFLQNVLGVDLVDNDVRDELGGMSSAIAAPAKPGFSQDFIAYGGCLVINEFDSIRPLAIPDASAGHEFVDTSGTPFGPAASVVHDRLVTSGEDTWRRVDISFPFGLRFIYSRNDTTAFSTRTTRSLVLQEVFSYFGNPHPGGTATANGGLPSPSELLGNYPNPFNPATTIRFRAGSAGDYSLVVYNLRGERVRNLLHQPLLAGEHAIAWDGRDSAGQSVSSGAYVYRLQGPEGSHEGRMVLLK